MSETEELLSENLVVHNNGQITLQQLAVKQNCSEAIYSRLSWKGMAPFT